MHGSKRVVRAAVPFAVVGVLVLAFLSIVVLGPASDARAQSGCGTSISCPDVARTPDPDVRSVANISHYENVYVDPRRVVPDTGDDWTITAKYASLDTGEDCNCDTDEFTATVEIDWSVAQREFEIAASSGITTTPYSGIDLLCGDMYCSEGQTALGYGYRIGVDLFYTVWKECPIDGWTPYYLDQVLYTTTAVGNGEYITADCNLTGTPAVPVSQIFQVGDNGSWTCTDGGCPTGIVLQIKY